MVVVVVVLEDEEEADRYRCGSMQTLTPVYDGVAVTEATWRCSSANAAAADWDADKPLDAVHVETPAMEAFLPS